MKVDHALVGDHMVDTPLLARRVEGVLPDLKPLEARLACGRRIVHLGEPRRDGALVRLGDRVIHVVRELRAANDVTEVSAELVSRCDGYDLVGGGALLLADDV